jgi:hypothetical protein
MVLNASYVCLLYFSVHRGSPDLDPGRWNPDFWDGSVIVGSSDIVASASTPSTISYRRTWGSSPNARTHTYPPSSPDSTAMWSPPMRMCPSSSPRLSLTFPSMRWCLVGAPTPTSARAAGRATPHRPRSHWQQHHRGHSVRDDQLQHTPRRAAWCLHIFKACTTTANSRSWVGYFSSCFLNCLEAYATTWPSCINTHPKPWPDASQ